MKVGDLVRFRKCAPAGKLGIVTIATKPTVDPLLAIYYVAYEGGTACFTGNQLEVVNENR